MTVATKVKAAVAIKPTLDELQNQFIAIEAGISRLMVEKQGREVDISHEMPGSVAALEQVDIRLAAARQDWRAVADALQEVRAKEAAEQDALRPQLEADRDAAENVLAEKMLATETVLGVLEGAAQATMQAGDAAYNAAIALGYNAGSQMATRDRLTARISHVLNLAGLRDFDISLSPSGRSPLGSPAEPYRSHVVEAKPLREQWNIHKEFTREDPGYPGQLLTNRPIVQRFLRGDDGEWVEVAPTAWELPEDGPS
jgi:hypothetical protein